MAPPGMPDTMTALAAPKIVLSKDIDLSWLRGQGIADVIIYRPGLWRFLLGGRASLDLECLWRVILHTRLALTSEDHNRKFGNPPERLNAAAKAMELLRGKTILDARIEERSCDLMIELSENTRLEFVSNSMIEEAWCLRDTIGIATLSQGGQISRWREPL